MRCWPVLLALSIAFPLHAQSDAGLPIELTWDAPRGCGGSATVLKRVREMLGTARIDSERHVRAKVTLRKTDAGTWQLDLASAGGESAGERRLEVKTCEEAAHAAALLLTLQLDPSRGLTSSEPADALPPESAKAPLPDAAAAPKPDSPPQPRRVDYDRGSAPSKQRRPRTQLGASGSVDVGSLPHVALGASLEAGLLFDAWRVLLTGSAWAPNRAASGSLSGAGAEFNLYDAALLACIATPGEHRLRPELCGGFGALYMRAAGFGVAQPSSAHAVYWRALVELGARFTLTSSWSLRFGASLAGVAPRPAFALRNLDTLHRSSPVVGRFVLGVDFTFE